MPTFLNTFFSPQTSSATISIITLDTDCIVKRAS